MRRSFVILILLLLLLQNGTAFGNAHLTNILEGIREKYGNLPGLSISYAREVTTQSMSMLGDQVTGDLATGQMFFKPPYFLRLEQKTPSIETLIANEDTLWWYIPDKKRAHKYSSQEFGKELRLLSDIFRGLTQVTKNFQIVMNDQTEQGNYQIELIPDPPWQEIDRIVLTVTTAYDIQIVNIHNRLGTTTRFTLEGLTVKKTFEKGFFKFVVPVGVQLLEEKS
ncbi:MAG: outer membrane lipoprotein carrier protein LolA [Desulfobacteraceae bacterium]|nr:MAG: outer membrane lipoprotein carrier protein LolA [Desulfobacteraceae bacterium]